VQNNLLQQEQLDFTKATLHEECDFTLENYKLRQTALETEVDALKQAKAMLSGSKFEAFLQDA